MYTPNWNLCTLVLQKTETIDSQTLRTSAVTYLTIKISIGPISKRGLYTKG